MVLSAGLMAPLCPYLRITRPLRLLLFASYLSVLNHALLSLAISLPRAIQGSAGDNVLVRFAPLLLFPLLIMDDRQETIGLMELLDEVHRDLDELRKKHPSDYNIRNITMWWDLEKERLLARHSPGSVVRKLRKIQGVRKMIAWFFVGWLMMLVVQIAMRLLMG
jgi:hypothetical protein